jgi:D-glycero-beta-D-manno-heptose-7-phosphate kinase
MVMVTLGDQGIIIRYQTDGHHLTHSQPAYVRTISDVSGAGDTVISVAALCLAIGLNLVLMAFLANLAGGIVCEYVGVVPIEKERCCVKRWLWQTRNKHE